MERRIELRRESRVPSKHVERVLDLRCLESILSLYDFVVEMARLCPT